MLERSDIHFCSTSALWTLMGDMTCLAYSRRLRITCRILATAKASVLLLGSCYCTPKPKRESLRVRKPLIQPEARYQCFLAAGQHRQEVSARLLRSDHAWCKDGCFHTRTASQSKRTQALQETSRSRY